MIPLSDKNDVKIFVLFLMDNINYPLEFEEIEQITLQNGFVNFFDFKEFFFEMIEDALILELPGEGGSRNTAYSVSERGVCVARELRSDLLDPILEKCLSSALRYLSFKKRRSEFDCNVKPLPCGRAELTCVITENKKIIFSTAVVVDTLDRAEKMRANFLEKPEVIYRGTLALLSGRMDYLF